MKKIISLALALMMVITMAVPAFSYSTFGNYSTKVENEEYYKKFLKDKFDTTVSYCNESNDKENECNTVKCVDKKKRECINDEE